MFVLVEVVYTKLTTLAKFFEMAIRMELILISKKILIIHKTINE